MGSGGLNSQEVHDRKRFKQWPAVVPMVGQIVQIEIDEDIFEGTVKNRKVHGSHKDAFTVWIEALWLPEKMLRLAISPGARKPSVGTFPGKSPFWQIVSIDKYQHGKVVELYPLA